MSWSVPEKSDKFLVFPRGQTRGGYQTYPAHLTAQLHIPSHPSTFRLDSIKHSRKGNIIFPFLCLFFKSLIENIRHLEQDFKT